MKAQLLMILGVLMFFLPGYSQPMADTLSSDSPAAIDAHVVSTEDCPWVLKTNLLYDVLLSPSIVAEYRFSRRWSVHADFSVAWWSNKSKHQFYQLLQFSPEARFWLNSKQMWRGHYIGAFVGAGYYDLENGGDGYKGEFLMGGLSYGYMFPISRMFSLDAGIGVGYMSTEYEEYLPIEGHYVYQQKSRTGYIGPLKAKLSLVWHIGRK
jgi:hypothetical protein